MNAPHVLMIDNFDSFSFNLVDTFARAGCEVETYRNDIGVEQALHLIAERETRLLVLSPGPGHPHRAGNTAALVRACADAIPIFGVCLGHQIIVESLGGQVAHAGETVHGKRSPIRHRGHPLFAGIPEEFDAGRYHSLAARRLPDCLATIATCNDTVMAVAHRDAPVYGVQFHPESILTTHGQRLLANVVALALDARKEMPA